MSRVLNLAWGTGPLTFQHQQALYLLIVVGAILAWMLLQVEGWRKLFAPLLRCAVLTLLVVALAGPQRVTSFEGSAQPVVVDASRSITPAMREWTARLLTDGLHFRSSDPAIIFGLRPVSASVGDVETLSKAGQACGDCQPEGTDVEAALRKLASSAGGARGPVVLVTDGWENRGEAGRAASALLAAGIRLYVFTPPGAQQIPNVAMTQINLPRALPSAEPFEIGVTMLNMNDAPAAGTISLYENGRLIDQREVKLESRLQRFDFPVRTQDVGLISYRAEFKPADRAQDLYPEDDSLQGWVGIGARRKVLILTGKGRDAQYLQVVVKRLGLEPEVVDLSKSEFDGRLEGYNAVLLSNVPRSMLSTPIQNKLVAYVEKGGALATIGGDQSYGLGGYEGSELERALPVVSKPPEHKQQRRALVLIIDKSGSMGRDNKLVYAKAAARTASKTLNDDDYLEVIGFDSQPFVVVPLEQLNESRPYLADMIDRLRAQGTTYLMPAIKEAERALAGSSAAIKHVVILTDGETGGTAAMYYDLVSSMHREGGVTISTIAIGPDPNVRLLNAISQYGGGAFYHTYSPTTLPELFLQDVRQHQGEMTMVEKEFTPESSRPDPVLRDLAGRQLPPIKGFVETTLKPGATLDMFVERAARRAPLIASWHYGTGKALAITTDASGRWSSEWVREGSFNNLWDKLLSWMSPEAPTAEKFAVAMGDHEGRIDLRLTDYSEEAGRSSHLINAIVKRPDGAVEQLMLSEGAPGELATSMDAPLAGTYHIELKSSGAKQQTFPPLAYTVSPAALAELPRPGPNYDLLERLASATGGRLNPGPDEVALTRPKLEHRTSLASNLLAASILLIIAEALVRRLTA